jgi:hypothetical protein
MGTYLGWDIGGVHLKLSRLDGLGPGRASITTRVASFEIWRDPDGLQERLRALLGEACPGAAAGSVAAHGVTMTAELSDVFPSRAEGVRSILGACAAALDDAPQRVFDLDGRFLPPEEAMETPLRVAAANWLATARLAAGLTRRGLLIDVGSTTTDIIPLRGGTPLPAGRTDTERLVSGELVYTGALRTPPPCFARSLPLGGRACRLAAEHFALTADVYRVLGRITEEEYTVQTADGRGKGREESAARLARLACAEPRDLGEGAIEAIALALEARQVEQIGDGLRQVLDALGGAPPPETIVAGCGAFLAEAAARRAGLRSTPLEEKLPGVTGGRWAVAAPSAALALLLAEEAGERILPATR